MDNKKTESHKAIAAKGGLRTKELYGNEHFVRLGKLAGKARLKKYGSDYYKNLSRLGVEARRKKAQSKKGIVERVVDSILSE